MRVLGSFTDELVGGPGRPAMVKVAKGAGLVGRMSAIGALAGGGAHLADKARAGITGDPYGPQGSTLGAATKTGLGGALTALLLEGLAKARKR